jgi:hypothetical protein
MQQRPPHAARHVANRGLLKPSLHLTEAEGNPLPWRTSASGRPWMRQPSSSLDRDGYSNGRENATNHMLDLLRSPVARPPDTACLSHGPALRCAFDRISDVTDASAWAALSPKLVAATS